MARSVAVVIEWENVLLAGLDRPKAALQEIDRQASSFAQTSNTAFELLVIYNPEEVDPDLPRAAVSQHIRATCWRRVELLPAAGLHYFDQKNFGARRTDSDIVVFFDSDVIPEEQWLRFLLEAFNDGETMISAGCTYLDARILLGRWFALFWFFPPKLPYPEVREAKSFYANNVAFRRDFFLANSFLEADCYRGQGTELSRRLVKQGHAIKRHGLAWVKHPPPNGLGHAFKRAIAKGYDTVYWNRRSGKKALRTSPIGAFVRFVRHSGVVMRRVRQRRRVLGASLPMAAGAVVFGWTFGLVSMFAECVAYVSPGLIRRNMSL